MFYGRSTAKKNTQAKKKSERPPTTTLSPLKSLMTDVSMIYDERAVYPQWLAAYKINVLLWPFIFRLAVIHILKPDRTKMTYFAI